MTFSKPRSSTYWWYNVAALLISAKYQRDYQPTKKTSFQNRIFDRFWYVYGTFFALKQASCEVFLFSMNFSEIVFQWGRSNLFRNDHPIHSLILKSSLISCLHCQVQNCWGGEGREGDFFFYSVSSWHLSTLWYFKMQAILILWCYDGRKSKTPL